MAKKIAKPSNPPLLALPNYTGGDHVELRDYFAAKALPTLLSENEHHSMTAKRAYQIADWMLKERKK